MHGEPHVQAGVPRKRQTAFRSWNNLFGSGLGGVEAGVGRLPTLLGLFGDRQRDAAKDLYMCLTCGKLVNRSASALAVHRHNHVFGSSALFPKFNKAAFWVRPDLFFDRRIVLPPCPPC